jgi:heme/copper-type cytochrome/quinol oxidase subunit 3
MIITAYILSAVVFFVLFIAHEKRKGYIEKRDLFFMMLASAYWPLITFCWLLLKFFSLLEKVVNKSWDD